jgi:transcriptional regulator GlxA family with amidase domain
MPARGRNSRSFSAPRGARRTIVARAESYVQENMPVPVPVSTLSRAVGLSERALRNAFYDVHGVGPKRWMLDARLRDVHRALERASAGTITVTRIATAHGFFELGRFAATYKATFGQSPSATLRATACHTTLDVEGAVERTR